MCVRASMKAAKPLHIVLATYPNPTRARGYPLNINPKPDPKPDSISGPAGSGRVADLYPAINIYTYEMKGEKENRPKQSASYIGHRLPWFLNIGIGQRKTHFGRPLEEE